MQDFYFTGIRKLIIKLIMNIRTLFGATLVAFASAAIPVAVNAHGE